MYSGANTAIVQCGGHHGDGRRGAAQPAANREIVTLSASHAARHITAKNPVTAHRQRCARPARGTGRRTGLPGTAPAAYTTPCRRCPARRLPQGAGYGGARPRPGRPRHSRPRSRRRRSRLATFVRRIPAGHGFVRRIPGHCCQAGNDLLGQHEDPAAAGVGEPRPHALRGDLAAVTVGRVAHLADERDQILRLVEILPCSSTISCSSSRVRSGLPMASSSSSSAASSGWST
jgi:hypothetical protein